jgi:tRNA G10  N-methylase Trm11
MEYKYGKNDNYEDFSSGRVLYHGKSMTNFPVRLAQEIYGRCLQYSPKKTNICLYDCCCGGGYLLTVLGFLNQDTIKKIVGSDIDIEILNIAKKNLSLLSKEEINKRITEIEQMIASYQKQSHIEAKNSAITLKGLIRTNIEFEVFQSDALKAINLKAKPDIITDVPYGYIVDWRGNKENVIDKLLDALYEICSSDTIIGLCMNKKQKVRNEKFTRLEKQQIGKRKFEILKKINEFLIQPTI